MMYSYEPMSSYFDFMTEPMQSCISNLKYLFIPVPLYSSFLSFFSSLHFPLIKFVCCKCLFLLLLRYLGKCFFVKTSPSYIRLPHYLLLSIRLKWHHPPTPSPLLPGSFPNGCTKLSKQYFPEKLSRKIHVERELFSLP